MDVSSRLKEERGRVEFPLNEGPRPVEFRCLYSTGKREDEHGPEVLSEGLNRQRKIGGQVAMTSGGSREVPQGTGPLGPLRGRVTGTGSKSDLLPRPTCPRPSTQEDPLTPGLEVTDTVKEAPLKIKVDLKYPHCHFGLVFIHVKWR